MFPRDVLVAVLISFTLAMSVNVVCADEPAELTLGERHALELEAGWLWSEARDLEKEGKVREAVAAYEKKLAADRKRLGDAHRTVALDLEWLANRHERLDDLEKAKSARKESL